MDGSNAAKLYGGKRLFGDQIVSKNPYCPSCDNLSPNHYCNTCDLDFSGKTALRFNGGKTDLTLIPIDAQEEEARVWMRGVEKYGRANWERLWGEDTVQVVMASLLRHAAAIQKGEIRDPETGAMHAGHLRCNAAMLIRYFNQLEATNGKKETT